MYGRIYKITNKLNNKSYIGLTTKSIYDRFQGHLETSSKRNSAIHAALVKYGKENFSLVELDDAFTKEELFAKEVFWIKEFNTFNCGYNLTEGGGGITNMSVEMRTKISNSKKGIPNPKLQGREISTSQRLEISRTLGGKSIRMFNVTTQHEIILEWAHQATELGFNPSNVISVCKGNRKHTKGYVCEYIAQGNPDRITKSKELVAVQRIGNETLTRI